MLLAGIAWLIRVADSATPTIGLVAGAGALLFLGMRFVNKRLIGTYLVGGLVILATANAVFGLSDLVLSAVGRNATLTGRTELWQQIWQFSGDPIIGNGFEGFWLGERLTKMWDLYWWHVNEAHNGYCGVLLNLGIIGLILLAAWLYATFRKCCWELVTDFEFGRFALSLFMATLVYNITEAALRFLHPVLFTLFLISLNYPKSAEQTAEQEERSAGPQCRGGDGIGVQHVCRGTGGRR